MPAAGPAPLVYPHDIHRVKGLDSVPAPPLVAISDLTGYGFVCACDPPYGGHGHVLETRRRVPAPSGEERFVQCIRTHFNQGVRSCEEALRFERVRGGPVSSTQVRFTSVAVRDDRATVELVEPDSDDPTGLTVVRLEKLADKWKIYESRVEPLWASLGD